MAYNKQYDVLKTELYKDVSIILPAINETFSINKTVEISVYHTIINNERQRKRAPCPDPLITLGR